MRLVIAFGAAAAFSVLLLAQFLKYDACSMSVQWLQRSGEASDAEKRATDAERRTFVAERWAAEAEQRAKAAEQRAIAAELRCNITGRHENQASSADTTIGKEKVVEVPVLRSRLHPPSTEAYNFSSLDTSKETYMGQIKQDKWVDGVLRGMRNGFAIESGAQNGEGHSNTVFFEVFRNWNCLLVEANPFYQAQLHAKHRKSYVLDAGLSTTGAEGILKFESAAGLGGIVSTFTDAHKQRIVKTMNNMRAKGAHDAGTIVDIPVYPLMAVLAEVRVRTVDYWSLDVEGAELAILKTVDFHTLEIGLLTIEHQEKEDGGKLRGGIKEILEKNGFQRVEANFQDDYYANPSYFKKRNIPFPR